MKKWGSKLNGQWRRDLHGQILKFETEAEAAANGATAAKLRGFAAMDSRVVSAISRAGGKAAHVAGTAHEFTTEEAKIAGRRGGAATHARRGAQREERTP